MVDINLQFHDEQTDRDIWFWKSPINYTMFLLENADQNEGEDQAGIIWDFRCHNGIWSVENTSIFHQDYGKGGECSVISSEDQLPPAEGWDEDTPPELREYLQRVHNMARQN